MSSYIEVIAIVEGKTEQTFIESILKPYLGHKLIGIHATQVSKKGQKGGDVRFDRVQKDLILHLRQRPNTYITTFIDYYGTKEWPGLKKVPANATPDQIAATINQATLQQMVALLPELQVEKRFIPYVAVHEFEALLFSDPELLAHQLSASADSITALLNQFGSPEAINNDPNTAPSKRLDGWSPDGKFPKTTTGIEVARQIGIEKMRQQCANFHRWLTTLETIQQGYMA